MTATAITVIGGGPVGLVLALRLQQQNIPVTVLESLPKGGSYAQTRALALSENTRQALMRLGVWETLLPQTTTIKTIHISQQKGFGRAVLTAQEQGLPALGYVVSYGDLMRTLDTQVHASGLDVIYKARMTELTSSDNGAQVVYQQHKAKLPKKLQIDTQLAVIADGGHGITAITGIVRDIKEYGHDALVTQVVSEQAHHHIAYERFTPQGPIALLPNGKRDFTLVWTGKKSEVDALLALDEAQFLSALHSAFGDRVGQFLQIAERISFPLKQARLSQLGPKHIVTIGNAAQTMHPVAGQGFNVGIRDAWHLASCLHTTPQAQWGSAVMLHEFRLSRTQDAGKSLWFTDTLVSIFSNDLVGLGILRGAGLGLLGLLPMARRYLVNKMSYGR